ncbi:MAG: peptidoglycan DD-metalloendopeptidase family protein [Oscillospiraceae bacterium]|nr:peptidoglycan DD-metalloendopeptidase family protein [Oscillospiraceae bacterium]
MKRKNFMKICALSLACVMSMGIGFGNAGATELEDEIAALEQKQRELSYERERVEQSLKDAKENIELSEQYMEQYEKKMELQEEEIANIEDQIALLQVDIDELGVKITAKEAEINEGIEDFKKRLRAMYMNGSDSLASILVGSSDFYDILARTELMENMSRHDNEMIDDLTGKIGELNLQKADMELRLTEQQEKKAQAENVLVELRETYANHEQTKEWYENQAEANRQRTAEMEIEEAQNEEALQEFIRRRQAELEEQRRREEEERKRKEEEERQRKEEEERQRKEEEERKRLEAEAAGVEYVPEDVDSEPEPEPEDTYKYATGASEGFIWPVPTVRNITDGYGSRYIVETGKNDFHKGIDINKPNCAGETIVASASGTVITASNTGNGYGIHVVIDHGDKIATLYGHMSSCCVNVGDEVVQGQTIGYIGCTGMAFGNHCHFEVRLNGQHTDPFNYVSM